MDDFSYRLLQLFSVRDSLTADQLDAILNQPALTLAEPINYLRRQKYIQIEYDYAIYNKIQPDSPLPLSAPLQITYEGRVALEAEQKNRKHFKFNELRAWITLAFAIPAFLISIFNLYLLCFS